MEEKTDIHKKIASFINEMPSLPISAGKVLEICDNVNVSPMDLNRIISLDPVLTGRLLKLINSAYYGLNSRVTTLVKAITMLGVNTVKNLALSTAILGVLNKNKSFSGFDVEGYWRHCLCVGVTTKLLAAVQDVDPRYHQEYFTAGLLHDIGKIPLNAVLAEDYTRVIAAADIQRGKLRDVEYNSLGIDHCDTGAMIAAAWKLYSPISDVISYHHKIGEYKGEYINILYNTAVADYFSNLYEVGFAGNRNPAKPPDSVWQTIGLGDDTFESLKDKVLLEIEKAKIFLKI